MHSQINGGQEGLSKCKMLIKSNEDRVTNVSCEFFKKSQHVNESSWVRGTIWVNVFCRHGIL